MFPLPLLLSTMLADFDHPYRGIDHNLGFHSDLTFPHVFDRYYPNWQDSSILDFYRPWMNLHRVDGSIIDITTRDNNFTIIMDVRRFQPEEISVKVVGRCIVVEGKHEEKRDEHDHINREFKRKYQLPGRADVDQVSANISSDHVLMITAPLTKEPEVPPERTIKIELTGQPAFKHGPGIKDENQGTVKTNPTSGTEKKPVEENEIREELTTQGQEDGAKPEK